MALLPLRFDTYGPTEKLMRLSDDVAKIDVGDCFGDWRLAASWTRSSLSYQRRVEGGHLQDEGKSNELSDKSRAARWHVSERTMLR